MSVKSVVYANNLQLNTERGPSESIWNGNGTPNAWVEDFMQDPRLGLYFFDDFAMGGATSSSAGAAVTGSLGQWSIYVGKTGLIADASIVGGAITMTPGTSASNEPMVLQGNAAAFQITSGSSSGLAVGRLAFEARVALQSVTASMRDAFVGLAAGSTPGVTFPLTAAASTNNLTTTNAFIGFYNQYSGGGQDWCFVAGASTGSQVFFTNLASLVSNITGTAIAANTYYKLGFIFDSTIIPNALISSASTGQTAGNIARQMLRVFVNGMPAAAFLTQSANIYTASFPLGPMFPTIAIMNDVSSVGASTNAGSLSVDWLRTAQSLSA